MKDEEFCKIDTEFYGEEVDHINQIAMRKFNGRELKEYVEFAIRQANALKTSDECAKACDCMQFPRPLIIKNGEIFCARCNKFI